MEERKPSSWVRFDPFVELQHVAVNHDDSGAASDEVLDLAPGQDLVAIHPGGRWRMNWPKGLRMNCASEVLQKESAREGPDPLPGAAKKR
jgi:hypothetical protein